MSLLEILAVQVTERLGLTPRPAWQREIADGVEAVCQRHALSPWDLADRIRLDETLLIELAGHLTVGETFFMRCPSQFAWLGSFVAGLLKGDDAARVSLWSAGCATGEELYSALIAIEGAAPDPHALSRIDARGTDLNPESVATACAGFYRPWSFRGVPPGFLARYTVLDRGQRRVLSRFRRRASFECDTVQRELQRLAPASLDVVLFRNVAIYLSAQARLEIFRGFARVLRPEGVLLIAPSDPAPERGLFASPEGIEAPGIYRRADARAAAPEAHASGRRASPAPRPPPSACRPSSPPAAAAVARAAAASRPESHAAAMDAASLRALADQGQVEEALQTAAAWGRASPDDPAPPLLRGQLLLSAGRVEDAVASLRQATFLAAADPLVRFWYASALHLAERPEQARRQLRVAAASLESLGRDALLSDGETQAAELQEATRFLEETMS